MTRGFLNRRLPSFYTRFASLGGSRSRATANLWRIDFSRARQPHYDWIRTELSGVPGCLFLTREKTWSVH